MAIDDGRGEFLRGVDIVLAGGGTGFLGRGFEQDENVGIFELLFVVIYEITKENVKNAETHEECLEAFQMSKERMSNLWILVLIIIKQCVLFLIVVMIPPPVQPY